MKKQLTAEEILSPEYVLWFFQCMDWFESLDPIHRSIIADGFEDSLFYN